MILVILSLNNSRLDEKLIQQSALQLQVDIHAPQIAEFELQMKKLSELPPHEIERIQSIQSAEHCQTIINQTIDTWQQEMLGTDCNISQCGRERMKSWQPL